MQQPIKASSSIIFIVGSPINKVRSAEMVNDELFKRGIDAVLVPIQLSLNRLSAFTESVRAMENVLGFIVTTPFKNEVVRLLDRKETVVSEVGVCNIVKRTSDGRLVGTLGDGVGLVHGLQLEGYSLFDKNVLLLGAGAAASAIGFAVADAGAKSLTIINRTPRKSQVLSETLKAKFPSFRVSLDRPESFDHIEVVINGTSLGMVEGDPLPMDPSVFRAGTLVAEVIGTPDMTDFLSASVEAKCTPHYGSHLLRGQLDYILSYMVD